MANSSITRLQNWKSIEGNDIGSRSDILSSYLQIVTTAEDMVYVYLNPGVVALNTCKSTFGKQCIKSFQRNT